MSLIVCKFGGTSVASPERIQMVAKKLIAKKQAGHDVVAVVSAMGKTTDELVGLAAALNDNPPLREMDRLLSTGAGVHVASGHGHRGARLQGHELHRPSGWH